MSKVSTPQTWSFSSPEMIAELQRRLSEFKKSK